MLTQFLLFLGGGGRDDFCKSVVGTLSDLWGQHLPFQFYSNVF